MASADAGKLYVFFGEDSTDASGILQPAPQTITVGGAIGVGYLEVRTSAAGANLGLSSSSAGDFDADGIVDLVVGTARGDSAYLFLGDAAYPTGSPQTLDVSTADIIFNKETTGDFFGAAVARAGDFNKDGYGDVMFGAFKSNNGGTERGQAYIVFGRPITSSLDVDISLFANVVITTTTDRSWLGHSVGLVGDVNGDGFVDVGVGAPADKGNTDMDGFVYIFKGDSAYSVGTQQQFVTSDAHFIVDLNENDNECGNAFAGIGDITGDGFDDFAVGARNHLVGANLGEGEVLLFSGKAATDTYNATDASLIITGVADTDDFFGWCLSSGDVDGNGTVDLLIGVPFYDAGGTWRGGLMILKDTSITNATEINYNNALLPVPDFVTISGLEDNGVFGTFGEGQQD
ncbi:MAG: FG-GAP repeat protein [Planctomycetaceae bacterium]|nr:FG-GAP repeat protein [Planctomycetaceae bacterium]